MKSLILLVVSVALSILFMWGELSYASNGAPPLSSESNIAESKKPQLFELGAFEDPVVCSHCHKGIYNQWSKSMHS